MAEGGRDARHDRVTGDDDGWPFDEVFVPRKDSRSRLRRTVDSALGRMSPLLDELCVSGKRAPVPSEYLLRSSFLTALLAVLTGRQLCHQPGYIILCRRCRGVNVEQESFRPTTTSRKSREPRPDYDAVRVLFSEVVVEARCCQPLPTQSTTRFSPPVLLLSTRATAGAASGRETQSAAGPPRRPRRLRNPRH